MDFYEVPIQCRKDQPGTSEKVKFFYPATCKHKSSPTSSPTHSPTTSPTDSPTKSPPASPSIPQSYWDAMIAPSVSSLSSASLTAKTSTSESATSSTSESNSITHT
jgi:hypothetical protein